MHLEFLDILVCPACPGESRLDPAVQREADGEIEEGMLNCRACGRSFAISNGIVRFVEPEADYCGNFGFQWRRWKSVQVDRLSGHRISETRFFKDSRWDRDWIKDKLILDAGCGSGRFTDVALSSGARVAAVDLSAAIDACRENTRIHGRRVLHVQASLYALPFRKEVFDGAFCMGVIQHTPDPAAVMRALPAFVKAGGRIAYNFYEEGMWRRLQIVKYFLRLFTVRLSVERNLALARFLVALFFPLGRLLAAVPKVRILNHFLPICMVSEPSLSREAQRDWTLLDTLDWYGPKYEKRQRHRDVAALLEGLGLAEVDSAPGLAWARTPYRTTSD